MTVSPCVNEKAFADNITLIRLQLIKRSRQQGSPSLIFLLSPSFFLSPFLKCDAIDRGVRVTLCLGSRRPHHSAAVPRPVTGQPAPNENFDIPKPSWRGRALATAFFLRGGPGMLIAVAWLSGPRARSLPWWSVAYLLLAVGIHRHSLR